MKNNNNPTNNASQVITWSLTDGRRQNNFPYHFYLIYIPKLVRRFFREFATYGEYF